MEISVSGFTTQNGKNRNAARISTAAISANIWQFIDEFRHAPLVPIEWDGYKIRYQLSTNYPHPNFSGNNYSVSRRMYLWMFCLNSRKLCRLLVSSNLVICRIPLTQFKCKLTCNQATDQSNWVARAMCLATQVVPPTSRLFLFVYYICMSNWTHYLWLSENFKETNSPRNWIIWRRQAPSISIAPTEGAFCGNFVEQKFHRNSRTIPWGIQQAMMVETFLMWK